MFQIELNEPSLPDILTAVLHAQTEAMHGRGTVGIIIVELQALTQRQLGAAEQLLNAQNRQEGR